VMMSANELSISPGIQTVCSQTITSTLSDTVPTIGR
jgi:hypothetical protein